MKSTISDPVQQQRVLVEFTLRQDARVQRIAQIRKARFGAAWLWVLFAAMVWLPVGAAWLVDLSSVVGRVMMFGPVVAMSILGLAMTRSVARAREELFLAIIAEEAPESFRRLKHEGVIQ
jgi:hypothetical protein